MSALCREGGRIRRLSRLEVLLPGRKKPCTDLLPLMDRFPPTRHSVRTLHTWFSAASTLTVLFVNVTVLVPVVVGSPPRNTDLLAMFLKVAAGAAAEAPARETLNDVLPLGSRKRAELACG